MQAPFFTEAEAAVHAPKPQTPEPRAVLPWPPDWPAMCCILPPKSPFPFPLCFCRSLSFLLPAAAWI